MSDRGVEVKVGILVTVCVALLVVFIMVLGGVGGGGDAEVVYLDVDSSSALKAGAAVKVAGVAAGEVADVKYMGGAVDEKTGEPTFVRVTLEIDKDKLATLSRDAKFAITTQGILGEKYVEIEPVATGDKLESGDVVRGQPPMAIEAMAANANRVMRVILQVLERNEDNLDTIIADAAATMKTVRAVAERADAMLARVDKLVGDREPDVAKALDELIAIEAEVKTLVQSANVALGDGTEIRGAIRNVTNLLGKVRAAVPEVVADVRLALGKYSNLADVATSVVSDARGVADGAIASVEAILADVKILTERLRDGQGTLGALISDQEMYDDIREMMKDLKRHPWKFIWKE